MRFCIVYLYFFLLYWKEKNRENWAAVTLKFAIGGFCSFSFGEVFSTERGGVPLLCLLSLDGVTEKLLRIGKRS